jgi:FtsP/CotA-like multicopper oxidase with cupredoxin domain
VIQDRSFNADGSLFYPETRAFFEGVEPQQLRIPFIPNSRSDISPIWNPEAFFNVMVVNGASWPKLQVAPALYRFRLLNGCNSRFLWLKFDDPAVEVWQIGAEQGFLPAPVFMNGLDLEQSGDGTAQLLIALAERADVIVDFRGLADGTEVAMLNIGPDEPFGGGIPGVDFDPADPDSTGQVMKFVVSENLVGASPTDPGGATPATDPLPAGCGVSAHAWPYRRLRVDKRGEAHRALLHSRRCGGDRTHGTGGDAQRIGNSWSDRRSLHADALLTSHRGCEWLVRLCREDTHFAR